MKLIYLCFLGFVLSNVRILFLYFFKKSCLVFNLKSLMQSWLNGGKRSHDLKRRKNSELHSKSVSASFHISNRPLPFHLHLHGISKFLDSETEFLLNKCCQSASLFSFKKEKRNFINTSRIRSQRNRNSGWPFLGSKSVKNG